MYARAGILLLAITVRFWGIGFGLPHQWARPDEEAVMTPAVRAAQGHWNPHWFQYPSLYMYALSPVYTAYYVNLRARGLVSSRRDLFAMYGAESSAFRLLDRCLAAALGAPTVFALYWAARPILTTRAALAASAF